MLILLTGRRVVTKDLVVARVELCKHLVRHWHHIDGKNVVQQADISVHPAVVGTSLRICTLFNVSVGLDSTLRVQISVARECNKVVVNRAPKS